MKILLTFTLFLSLNFSFGQKSKNYLIAYVDTTTGEELIGYKNSAGEISIKPKYTQAPETFDKMAIVLTPEFEFIGIDRNDSTLLKPYIFDNGPDYIVEGLFRFVENDKIGFANSDGQKIIKAKYDFVTPFENGIAEYTLGGHKEYDKDGEHWSWKGGDENGFINKLGQEFTKVKALKSKKHEAWTKDKKHVLLNKKGLIIKKIA